MPSVVRARPWHGTRTEPNPRSNVWRADRRRGLIVQTEAEVEEASDVLHRAVEVVRALPLDQQPRLNNELHVFQSELSKLRKEVLFTIPQTSNFYAPDTPEAEEQGRIIDGTRRLDETSDRLGRIQAVSEETVEIGVNALGDLQHQHSQLENARDMLGDMDVAISRGRRILSGLWWRLMTDKIVELAIIGILLLSIFLVVFFKWLFPLVQGMFGGGHGHDDSSAGADLSGSAWQSSSSSSTPWAL
eukprot:TRINITY_DN159_c0_g2_i3.p1 TRINITY_DN159_c0_g2~~TRINITY_DN159_c0_g2_i3.p1  ORF type:complete len:245 (+),score=53.80 TRINITY_DN159_c0_g2_i3:116-850(+)